MTDPLVTLIGIAIIAIVFIFFFVLPQRRSKEEKGKTLLYEERCNGRKKLAFGFYAGGNILNWRISFYDHFFVIASVGQTKISYGDIESVGYAQQWISKGIHIRVRNPQTDLVLYPKEPNKIMEIFRSKKVPVSGTV